MQLCICIDNFLEDPYKYKFINCFFFKYLSKYKRENSAKPLLSVIVLFEFITILQTCFIRKKKKTPYILIKTSFFLLKKPLSLALSELSQENEEPSLSIIRSDIVKSIWVCADGEP